MNDPADAGRSHADFVRKQADEVRRVTEAALAFPHLTASGRSELQNVLVEVDHDERIFAPEPDPAALKLFVERTDTLLQRTHTVVGKYTQQAS